MSRKNVVQPHKLLNQSALVDGLVTPATSLRYLDGAAVQVIWTANTSGTGVFTVEGTVHDSNPGSTATWSTLDLDPIPLSGTTGNFIINLNSIMFDRIRLKYTQSIASTGGKIDCYIMMKTVGA